MRKALTKADIAEKLFEDLGLNKREAKELVEMFFEEIRQSLEGNEQVKLSGFGNFDLRDKRKRTVCAATPARRSWRGGAADVAAIQFHRLTISRRMDMVTTQKAKPLDHPPRPLYISERLTPLGRSSYTLVGFVGFQVLRGPGSDR